MRTALALSLILCGCATAPKVQGPIKNKEIFAAPFDKVWSAMVTALADQGYDIDRIEKESGVLSTKAREGIMSDMAVKSWSMFMYEAAHYSLSIFVLKRSDTETEIKVNARILGISSTGPDTIEGESNGQVEMRILGGIRTRLENPGK